LKIPFGRPDIHIKNEGQMLLELGQIVISPGAMRALEIRGKTPLEYLQRHIIGDWGNLCQEDIEENNFSVGHDLRVLSAYKIDRDKIWVITEADRSATTILLPDEY
jgi:hypothetical protein